MPTSGHVIPINLSVVVLIIFIVGLLMISFI